MNEHKSVGKNIFCMKSQIEEHKIYHLASQAILAEQVVLARLPSKRILCPSNQDFIQNMFSTFDANTFILIRFFDRFCNFIQKPLSALCCETSLFHCSKSVYDISANRSIDSKWRQTTLVKQNIQFYFVFLSSKGNFSITSAMDELTSINFFVDKSLTFFSAHQGFITTHCLRQVLSSIIFRIYMLYL